MGGGGGSASFVFTGAGIFQSILVRFGVGLPELLLSQSCQVTLSPESAREGLQISMRFGVSGGVQQVVFRVEIIRKLYFSGGGLVFCLLFCLFERR